MDKQSIHFDLDTKELERYYPKDAWRNAYKDIRNFMRDNGFEHEQGSGYRSQHPMLRPKVIALLNVMRKNIHG
jgi:virulence-associated protein VapD